MYSSFELLRGPNRSPRSDQAVAAPESQAEPGCCTTDVLIAAAVLPFILQQSVNTAQPEGKRSQFNGCRVQIHTVDVACRDVVLDSPKFIVVLGRLDRLVELLRPWGEDGADARAIVVDKLKAEGPQVDTTKSNVVDSQDEVDDLLSSLGF